MYQRAARSSLPSFLQICFAELMQHQHVICSTWDTPPLRLIAKYRKSITTAIGSDTSCRTKTGTKTRRQRLCIIYIYIHRHTHASSNRYRSRVLDDLRTTGPLTTGPWYLFIFDLSSESLFAVFLTPNLGFTNVSLFLLALAKEVFKDCSIALLKEILERRVWTVLSKSICEFLRKFLRWSLSCFSK